MRLKAENDSFLHKKGDSSSSSQHLTLTLYSIISLKWQNLGFNAQDSPFFLLLGLFSPNRPVAALEFCALAVLYECVEVFIKGVVKGVP